MRVDLQVHEQGLMLRIEDMLLPGQKLLEDQEMLLHHVQALILAKLLFVELENDMDRREVVIREGSNYVFFSF